MLLNPKPPIPKPQVPTGPLKGTLVRVSRTVLGAVAEPVTSGDA